MNDIAAKAAGSATKPVDYQREIPEIIQRMIALEGLIKQHGIDKMLLHLVKLRASQINGCAHCVKMHTKEARDDGETNERLDRLVVWKHVGDYSERERAALPGSNLLDFEHPAAEVRGQHPMFEALGRRQALRVDFVEPA